MQVRVCAQVSPSAQPARDPAAAGQDGVPDDGALPQRILLLPHLRHAQHGPAHRQALLERAADRLVRHRKVHHQPGTAASGVTFVHTAVHVRRHTPHTRVNTPSLYTG